MDLYKFKFYTLSKLFQVFTNQYHTKNFDSSRKAFYCAMLIPPTVILGFIIASPLSVYKGVAIWSSIIGNGFNVIY